MRLAALSVDLDEIPCYHAIHGLPEPTGSDAHAVYDRAVSRFTDLFARMGVPATFFAIGRDLARPAAAERIRALDALGHELGNHTQNHCYDLVRLDIATMRSEVSDGAASIRRVTGRAPAGFRAPGYTTSDALLRIVGDSGARYDSSVFPCPAYYAAKTAAIAWIGARGRTSHSIVDTPNVLRAPADPYSIGEPYWRIGADDRLIELPIGVTRGPRLPFIGTSVMLAGPERARWFTRAIVGRPLVNLELHGLDLLSANDDSLHALAKHQRDLLGSVERKLATLESVVNELRNADYRFVTLRDAADAFRAPP